MKILQYTFVALAFCSVPARANCPEGFAFAKEKEVEVQVGVPPASKACRLSKADLRDEPLPVQGCFPVSGNPQYVLVKAPEKFSDPCFSKAPASLYLKKAEVSIEASASRDCAECNAKKAASPYANRDNPIALLINDMQARDNKLKTFDKIEKYHRCLLNNKKEKPQSEKYEARYRYLVAVANESFDVPVAMLTCLCGRESRFNAQAANDESTAKGICQAMNGSLADVERWRKTIPALKKSWDAYVTRLGNKLEDPTCANQPLTHDILMKCPSLGLGVASVYLKYVYSRVTKNPTFSDLHWESQSVGTLVTVAGSYFAGAGFAERALKKANNRSEWQKQLMNEVCVDAAAKKLPPDWSKRRLSELRNHMTAVRNCIQDDNWLDHQGNAMGGECAMPAATTSRLSQEMTAFRGALPTECPAP